MSLTNYPKFKISINPDSKKTQGLQPGDIVRRQYSDGISTIYTLMVVLAVGFDEVPNDKGVIVKSHYFIGALLEGDIPNSQQVLDFVRTTNLFNADRSGAIYMTASDSDAPFLKVLDKLGTEKSLCLPYLSGSSVNQPSKNIYTCIGESFLTTSYSKYSNGSYRAYKVIKKTTTNNAVQIKVTFQDSLQIQDKVLISYKIRANKNITLPFSFGYTDNSSYDASGSVSSKGDWEYKLHIVQIDAPSRNTRSFLIDLASLSQNDWVEIAELNIIKLSDVANFSDAGKAIIGNLNSTVDPIFGSLKGYGIHTQNFYATQNVGIAGTLTAGDSNGFSSTFYAGRIYKNMIKNSLNCDFNNTADKVDIKIPAKIGSAYKFKTNTTLHRLTCRESGWSINNKGDIITFSIWIYSSNITTLNLYQNTNLIDSWNIYQGWRRYYTSFPVTESGDPFYINFETNEPLIVCSPQLEKGDIVSQYQPTDGTLKEDSEGYGAWFCEGGIGGTIQNPLLKLGPDGSIRSRNDNFYILPDGSAYFKGQVEIGDKSTINGTTLIKDGTINTDVLNVRAIFAKNIETETIVGGNLTFQKGKIGGWLIEANRLTSETTPGRDHIELSTTGGIQAIVASKTIWQLSPTGSGILASGKIRWDKNGNTTIAGWNISDTQLYSTPTSNNEKLELNSNGSIQSLTGSTVNWLFSKDGSGKLARGNVTWDKAGNLSLVGSITAVGGTIGGWTINSSSIKKNNIYLGSDGSIYHTSNYWKLNNDGSGQLAGGAIKWGTDGVWNVDKITAKSGSIAAWNIDGDSIYSGTKQANNDFTSTGITLSSAGALRAKQFRIDTNGNAFFKGTLSAATGTFSGNLSAAGGTFSGNLSAAGGTFKGSLSAAGGTFTGTLSGVNGDFSGRITSSSGSIGGWVIDSNSIYTGTKWNGSANWTNGITIHNNAIVTYTCIFKKDGSGQLADGKIKWDANGNLTIDGSVKVNATITAEQVNALTLTTTKGTIGGWNITSNSIYKNSVYWGSDGSLYNGNYWKLNNDGSGRLANGNITWTATGALSITGGISATSGKIGNFLIGNGWLTCNSTTGNDVGYIDMRSGNNRIAFGYDLTPAVAGGSLTCTAVITNNRLAESGGIAYALSLKASGNAKEDKHAVALGCEGGVRIKGEFSLIEDLYTGVNTNISNSDCSSAKNLRSRRTFIFQPSTYTSIYLPSDSAINNEFGYFTSGNAVVDRGAITIRILVSAYATEAINVQCTIPILDWNADTCKDNKSVSRSNFNMAKGDSAELMYYNRRWYLLRLTR